MAVSPLIPPAQMATLQSIAVSVMNSTATLTRNGSLVNPQPVMPDGSTLKCRVRADTTEYRSSDLPNIQSNRRWVITVPNSVDIRVNDRITALGYTYLITQVANPNTLSVQNTCYGYIASTSGGQAAQGMTTNAAVNTYYNGATKLTLLAVYLETPSPKDMADYGGVVRYVLLAPAGSDLRAGDVVKIQTFGLNTVDTTRSYHVISADPSGAPGMENVRAIIGENTQG